MALRLARASVLTFKCHNPVLLIMLGPVEAPSDLVQQPGLWAQGSGPLLTLVSTLVK